MGINRPSLYATFGDKESLFLKAMARYAEGPAGYVRAALAAPTARLVVEALVNGAVELLGNPDNPRGCLSVHGALAAGNEAERIKSALVAWRKQGEVEIRKRLKRAQSEGDLPANLDAADITRYIATILNGLGVQASNGASKAQMARVAQMALQALPF
jgi:AcrR family transcriptional regulator